MLTNFASPDITTRRGSSLAPLAPLPRYWAKDNRDSAHVRASLRTQHGVALSLESALEIRRSFGDGGRLTWSWHGPHTSRGIVGRQIRPLQLHSVSLVSFPSPPETLAPRDQKSACEGGGTDAETLPSQRLSKVQNVVLHGRIAWRRVRSLTQIPRCPPSPVGRGNQGPRRFRFKGPNRVADDEAGKWPVFCVPACGEQKADDIPGQGLACGAGRNSLSSHRPARLMPSG